MGLFSKSKLGSDEFETLNKKIILIVGDIDALNAKLAVLKTNMNSLRSTVNRNFGEDEGEAEPKNLKGGMLLPE